MAESRNYPSNASKTRPQAAPKEEKPAEPERPALQPVVIGKAVERKQPLRKRIAATFVNDDAQGVGQYILFDVIMPAVKATISDAVSQGIERMLFGDVRSSRRSAVNGRTNYSQYSSNRSYPGKPIDTRGDDGRRTMTTRGRNAHDFKEIVFHDRGDAEAVLDGLSDQIEQFNLATVSDFYQLAEVTGDFQDNKWGWYTLGGAGIQRIRDGWLINLPSPEYLD